MQSCLFTNCMLIGCSIKKSQFSDIIFRNCDLSNVNFSESGFHRVEFIDCKLIGANFSESSLNHITFSNCKAEYINLTMKQIKIYRLPSKRPEKRFVGELPVCLYGI